MAHFPLICLFLFLNGLNAKGQCTVKTECHGQPDSDCHPTAKIFDPEPMNYTDIQCPQYKDSACCTIFGNEYLKENFARIENILAPECRACQLNVEQFYCDVLCSPDQYKYVQGLGYEQRFDTITKVPNVTVLRVGIEINQEFLCGAYDSCKSVYVARLMPAVGISSVNFMNYQAEGAVGMGVYFVYNYTTSNTSYNSEIKNCYGFQEDGVNSSCPCIGCQESCKADYGNNTVVVNPITLTNGMSVIGMISFTVIAIFLSTIVIIIRHFCFRQTHDETISFTVEDRETGQAKLINKDITTYSTRFFHWHASLCSHHPYIIIFVSVAMCLGLSSGVYFLKIESDPNQIWVDENSVTGQEAKYYHDTYGVYYRQEQALFNFPHNNSVLTRENLLELLALQTAIQTTKTSDNITLTDICFKPIKGEDCAIQSPLNYWKADAERVKNDPHIKLTPSCVVFENDETPCLSEIGAPVQRNVVWGWKGEKCDSEIPKPDDCSDACAPRADRMVIAILIESTNDTIIKYAENWEKEIWLKLLREQQEKFERGESQMSVGYMAERSISDEIVRETEMNILIVVLSYIVMFVYIGVALGKFPHPVYSRIGLTLAGMLVVILSVLSAIGVAGFVGWSVTLIVTDVLPFLILAIGVDSIFILVKEFNSHVSESQSHQERVLERLKVTLAAVGPSITCAAVCEVATFLLGLTTGISALMIFCSIAAIALVINFFLQMTFFFCALNLDVKRMENFRVDTIPCMPGCSNLSKIPDLRRSFYENNDPTPGVFQTILTGDYILRGFQKCAPYILSLPSFIISSILFFGFLGVSSYGITQLQLGLDQTRVLPMDSYLQQYFGDLYEFGQTGPLGYMLIKDIDYHNNETQNLLEALKGDLIENKYVQPPINSWIHSFLLRVQFGDRADGFCPELPPVLDNETFYKAVETFLEIRLDDICCQGYGVCGQQFATDVKFRYNSSGYPIGIKGSRISFQHSALVTQDDFITSVRSMEKIKETYNDLYGSDAFAPFGMFYVYFGQYETVHGLIFQAFFYAALTIFVCSLLITDISTAIITTVGVLVTIIDSVGIQWVLNLITTEEQGDVEINAIFLVNMIASMGISVEFIIHIASLYRRTDGTKYERARIALVDMGNRVFSGIGLTKVCGLIVLAFAPALIFRLYFFRVYFAVVCFGLFHGLIVIPSFLSRFGPGKNNENNKDVPTINAPLINDPVVSEIVPP